MSNTTPSVEQLQRAILITEQIANLEAELKVVLGGAGQVTATAPVKTTAAAKPAKKKRTMSPEARARIVAAQKERWAKIKEGKAAATPAPAAPKAAKVETKKGGLTAEGRARLAASMKARWAARKKGTPALNAPAKSAKPARKAKR